MCQLKKDLIAALSKNEWLIPDTPFWGIYDRTESVETMFKQLFSQLTTEKNWPTTFFPVPTASGTPGSGKTTFLKCAYDGFKRLSHFSNLVKNEAVDEKDTENKTDLDILTNETFDNIFKNLTKKAHNVAVIDYFQQIIPIYIDCKKCLPLLDDNVDERELTEFWLSMRIINCILQKPIDDLVREFWSMRLSFSVEETLDMIDDVLNQCYQQENKNKNKNKPPTKRCYVFMIDELMQLVSPANKHKKKHSGGKNKNEDRKEEQKEKVNVYPTTWYNLSTANQKKFCEFLETLPSVKERKPNRLCVTIITNNYETTMNDIEMESTIFGEPLPLKLLSYDASSQIIQYQFEKVLFTQQQTSNDCHNNSHSNSNSNSNNSNDNDSETQKEKFVQYWYDYVANGEFWRLMMKLNGFPRAFDFIYDVIRQQSQYLYNLLQDRDYCKLTDEILNYVTDNLSSFEIEKTVEREVLCSMIRQRGPIDNVHDNIDDHFCATWDDMRKKGVVKCENSCVPTILPFRLNLNTLNSVLNTEDSKQQDIKDKWKKLSQFKCLVNSCGKEKLFETYFSYQQLLSRHFLDDQTLSLAEYFGLSKLELKYRISDDLSKLKIHVQRSNLNCFEDYVGVLEEKRLWDKLVKYGYVTHSAQDEWKSVDAVLLLEKECEKQKNENGKNENEKNYVRLWIKLECCPCSNVNVDDIDDAFVAMENLVNDFPTRENVDECFAYIGFTKSIGNYRSKCGKILNYHKRILILNKDVFCGCYAYGCSFLLRDSMFCFVFCFVCYFYIF